MACLTDHLLLVHERRTPVYCKPRDIRIPGLMGEGERFDTKNWQTLPDWAQDKLISSLDEVAKDVDALIVMDQVEEEDCGVVTNRVRERVIELAREHPKTVIWADSRGRIDKFSGVTIKCNEREAIRTMLPGCPDEVTDESVERAGKRLLARSGKPVFVTRAEEGMLIFDGGGARRFVV